MNSEIKKKIQELKSAQLGASPEQYKALEQQIWALVNEYVEEQFKTELTEWRSKHKGVTAYKIFIKEDDVKVLFFRYPTRQEMMVQESVAQTEDGQENLHKMIEQRAHDCHLGGDIALLEALDDVEIYPMLSKFLLRGLIKAKNVNWAGF